MSIALLRSVVARSCSSLCYDLFAVSTVKRSLATKAMASITIDSSPLAGPPSPLSDADVVPLLDLDGPPSALEALAWPPQTTKPAKKATKKASKATATKKPAVPRTRKKKKPLLSTILPPEKAVASVQQLASTILYPPPLESTEKDAKTPNFKTQGWRTWLSQLTNASLRQPGSDTSLWETASGQLPSALYQSRVLAHAQTMASSTVPTSPTEGPSLQGGTTMPVPDVLYKHMLARLVKNVWQRCAVEQKEQAHRLTLCQQSVDRTISLFQQDVEAAIETELCSGSESEKSYSSSYWPSPTLSTACSSSSEASQTLSTGAESPGAAPNETSTLTQNEIMIACAKTIKSYDALWQPVLRYEPIEIDDFMTKLTDGGFAFQRKEVVHALDAMGTLHYHAMSKRRQARQAPAVKTRRPRKKKAAQA